MHGYATKTVGTFLFWSHLVSCVMRTEEQLSSFPWPNGREYKSLGTCSCPLVLALGIRWRGDPAKLLCLWVPQTFYFETGNVLTLGLERPDYRKLTGFIILIYPLPLFIYLKWKDKGLYRSDSFYQTKSLIRQVILIVKN